MECPFELPVKFGAYIPVGDSPVDNGYIDDAKGNTIIIPILREQADYIVHAINSHEKLLEYAQHKQDCNLLLLIPCVKHNGKEVGCDCGFEQALKEETEKPK